MSDDDRLRISAAKLRIVARNGERVRAPSRQTAKRPDVDKLFVQVPLAWLNISDKQGGYPAAMRLHLYLWFRSYQGRRQVRLTNELAHDVGLDRGSKLRRLRYLESRGLVTVAQVGKQAPVVTVHAPAALVRKRPR